MEGAKVKTKDETKVNIINIQRFQSTMVTVSERRCFLPDARCAAFGAITLRVIHMSRILCIQKKNVSDAGRALLYVKTAP